MNKFFSVILFIMVMLSSMACFAQDEVASFDTYIAELNSQCPIAYDDWSIKSLSLSADTRLLLRFPCSCRGSPMIHLA